MCVVRGVGVVPPPRARGGHSRQTATGEGGGEEEDEGAHIFTHMYH